MADNIDIELTAEQEAMIPAHVAEWREISHRTRPMSAEDRAAFTTNMIAFYKGANLPALSADRVFFARSPTEGRIMAGLMSAAYHMVAERAVGPELVKTIVRFCQSLPMKKSGTDRTLWYYHNYNLARIAETSGLGEWGATCVRYASRMWHGGNMDIATEAFVSFVRDKVPEGVARASLEFGLWNAWESTVRSAGGRFMHENFVVACDFPVALFFDRDGRPHGESGHPHVQWSDGSYLTLHHGLRVPVWMKMTPEKITVESVMNEQNAELRRAMLEIMGAARFISDADAKILDQDTDMYLRPRRLLRVDLPEPEEPVVMIEVTNSTAESDDTFRKYLLRVDPGAYNGEAGKTCQAAIASTWRRKEPGAPLMFDTPQDYVMEIET